MSLVQTETNSASESSTYTPAVWPSGDKIGLVAGRIIDLSSGRGVAKDLQRYIILLRSIMRAKCHVATRDLRYLQRIKK